MAQDPILAMNFAIVNGQKVPINDGGDDFEVDTSSHDDDFEPDNIDDFEVDSQIAKPELTRETPTALNLMNRAMHPLVDVSPSTRQHMAEFEQVHPYIGKTLRTGLDMMLGESSPLSLGLGVLGAGESVASGMGMEGLSNILKIPSRAAGGAMMWHGLSNVGNSDSLGGKIGGGLEAALGGLALKGPKMLERNPQIEQSIESSDKLAPGATNTLEEIDAARDRAASRRKDDFSNRILNPIPEFTTPEPQLERPTIPPEINPAVNLSRETPITADDMSFFRRFITYESDSVKLPKLGTRNHPLKALDELHDALIDASNVRENQQELYKGERSKRFAAVEDVATQGKKGMYERLSKLKGELPKANFEPVSINPDSARALYNEIQRSSLSTPEKIRASTGLGKVLGDYGNGQVPQRNEIEMMRKVFGDPVADKLIQMHFGVPITVKALNEIANASKSIMASYDASAPLRQGLGLVHTKEFWQNYTKMFSYLGKDAYNVAMQSINEDPMFAPLEKAGLQITEIGSGLGKREEQFASKLAEKIPGVPASERMYTGFLNKTRFDVSKRLMQESEKAGLKPFVKNSVGELVPTSLGREITGYVNTATGRGSLGRFEKNAVELNTLFFSPRLISSRLTMLNPNYYIQASPFVRKQALKSLFAIATAGKIVEELGKAAGGSVETADKTSSDYHKVRIGNTRLDPYGGFQQYVVAANRLLAGAYNSAMGNKEEIQIKTAFSRALGVGGRFGSFTENKLSPIAKFVDDIASGRPSEDNAKNGNVILNSARIPHSPFEAKVANLFTPMMLQDLQDLMMEDPSLIPLSILGASGMGVQTYEPTSSNNTGFRELSR